MIGDDASFRRIAIALLFLASLLWFALFPIVFNWIIRDLLGAQIWPSDKELKRRLDLYTSISKYGVNVLTPRFVPFLDARNEEEHVVSDILDEIKRGEIGSDIHLYEDAEHLPHKIVTVVKHTNEQKVAYIVEGFNALDRPYGGCMEPKHASDKMGAFKSADTLRIAAGRSKKKSIYNNGGKTIGSNYGASGKVNSSKKSTVSRDHISINIDDQNEVDMRTTSAVSRFKKRSRWCLGGCCFGKKNGSSDLDEIAVVDDLKTYQAVIVKKVFSKTERYLRGNFLKLVGDVVALGVPLVGIVLILSTADIPWELLMGNGLLVFFLGFLGIGKVLDMVTGYLNLTWGDRLYRGDIVDIIGTWTNIGGKITGVVVDVRPSEVLLFTDETFNAQFMSAPYPSGGSNAHPPSSSQSTTTTTTTTTSPEGNGGLKTVSREEKRQQYSQPPEVVKRFITVETGNTMPTVRNVISSSLGAGGNNDEHDASPEYFIFSQDIPPDIRRTKYKFDRQPVTLDFASLNASAVSTAVIIKKVGWSTNMALNFH
jgi:hypothetical protein